jgi:hypothetical protein
MSAKHISKAQLKRLQTLWGQYARHEMVANSRTERLRWANSALSHGVQTVLSTVSPSDRRDLMVHSVIKSFRDLTAAQASTLINLLQAELGIPETRPNHKPTYARRYKDRTQAQAAGTEGRKGQRARLTIATSEDLALIETQLQGMGWDRARLDAFLRSPSSPLCKRSNPTMRTLGDVNRVFWALKRIARSATGEKSEATL